MDSHHCRPWILLFRYYEALCALAKERGALTLRNLIDTVTRVNNELASEKDFADAVAAVNAAARGDDAAATHAALKHESLSLTDVRDSQKSEFYECSCPERYHAALKEKAAAGEVSRDDISSIVSGVNATIDQEQAFADALGATNAAITANDVGATITALMQPVLDMKDVDEAGAEQYLAALRAALDESSDPSLTAEEIQERITHTNFLAEEAAKVAASLFRINECVAKNDPAATCGALAESYAKLENVQEKCTERYHPALKAALNEKAGEDVTYEWKSVKTDDNRVYYYNRTSKVCVCPLICLLLRRAAPLTVNRLQETQWVVPAGPELEKKSLTVEEIQAVVTTCNDEQARAEFLDENTDKIVKAQSIVRAHQARKAYTERKGCVMASCVNLRARYLRSAEFVDGF